MSTAPTFHLSVTQPSTGLASSGDNWQEVTPVFERNWMGIPSFGPKVTLTWRETSGRGQQEKDLHVDPVALLHWLIDELAAAESHYRETARRQEKALRDAGSLAEVLGLDLGVDS